MFNFKKIKDLKNITPTTLTNMINESCKDHLGKSSSTRINGYIMTILFSICVFCCVGVEISSAIKQYHLDTTYTVSTQLLAMCALILGQQALLFNLKRKAEDTPFPTVEKLNANKTDVKEEVDIQSDEVPAVEDIEDKKV